MADGGRVAAGILDPLDLTGSRAHMDKKQARKIAREQQRKAEEAAQRVREQSPAMSQQQLHSRAEDYAERKYQEYMEQMRENRPNAHFTQEERRRLREHYFREYMTEHEALPGDIESTATKRPDLWRPDQEHVEAQKRTRGEYWDIYRQGGMDAITRAENEKARMQYAQQARGQREAALQNLAARGMAGSGATQAAQLSAGQNAANETYRARLDNLAEGRQRALQALGQHGQMAGRMRGQSLHEKRQRARQIDRFNQYNTDRKTENMWRQQQANLDAASLETQQYARRQQQAFGAQQRAGQRERQNRQNAVATVGTVLGSIYSDETAKQDIKPSASSEIGELLQSINASTYEYKPEVANKPGAGEGKQFGLMAQDLEKSELGKSLVHEGPDGYKRVDASKAALAALASGSDLEKRLRKLEKKGNG
jgi:hypothetical protein